MPTNQKGIVQVVVILILVAGLAAGLYLSQKTTIFKPKAYGGPVQTPITPIPDTKEICKSRLSSFSVNEPCDEVENGFQNAKFGCEAEIKYSNLSSQAGQGGKISTCRSVLEWAAIAQKSCSKLCQLPTPSSIPYPVPCPTPPACNGQLIGAKPPDLNQSQCPVYICVEPQLPIPVPTAASNIICPPYASFCPATNSCLSINEVCPKPTSEEESPFLPSPSGGCPAGTSTQCLPAPVNGKNATCYQGVTPVVDICDSSCGSCGGN